MTYTITPPATWANPTIDLPASKSISNRALILHALSRGSQRPQNLSDCDDTRVMINALEHPTADLVDIGAAGTSMRFLTAYLSVTPGVRTITGSERMKQRPIGILVDALRQLGAHIDYVGNEGYPPLRISGGTLTGSHISLPGNVSSQFVSALLMIGPTLPQGLRLELTGDIVSRPYIDMTLKTMTDFGAKAAWDGAQCIAVQHGDYNDVAYTVESDWSAASYWYQMLALTSCEGATVTLPRLFKDSMQGDSMGALLFKQLGIDTEFTAQGVVLRKNGAKLPVCLVADFVQMPDLAQTFVSCCCSLGVPFTFSGLQSLRIKETDRLAALTAELGKMGYVLTATDNTAQGSVLRWDGTRQPEQPNAVIATYEDHRMAMSMAPVCMTSGHLCMAHPEVVSKSYPRFWEHLRQAGFALVQ